VGTAKVDHRSTRLRKFENFRSLREPLSRGLRSPRDDQNVQFDKGNVAVVIKSRSEAESGQKKQNFSLPGSRTPRCPVTGDDVTDTPEEMLSWYQNKINSICSTTVRAADLCIIVAALNYDSTLPDYGRCLIDRKVEGCMAYDGNLRYPPLKPL
jgi:hypothetical protein